MIESNESGEISNSRTHFQQIVQHGSVFSLNGFLLVMAHDGMRREHGSGLTLGEDLSPRNKNS